MAGPASWAADSQAMREHTINTARKTIIERIQHVLPRLATDPALFPDLDEAKQLFQWAELKDVVRAIDAAQAEQLRNEQITKLWNAATDDTV